MANAPLSSVLRHLRKLLGPRPDATLRDAQLLERFARQHDEAAFEALVQRHGPLVLGLCRRILANVHDAEDAFQATFLLLARKAGSIRKPQSVGSWLHGVAYRLAVRARANTAQRRTHERQAEAMHGADPLAEVMWRELRPVLDEELQRLPEKYR